MHEKLIFKKFFRIITEEYFTEGDTMRSKLGGFFMFLGIVLITMALSLYLYNRWDSERAGRAADEIMDVIFDELSVLADEDSSTGKKKDEDDEGYLSDSSKLDAQDARLLKKMKTVSIDGYDYIGYLEVPDLDLRLPVMSEWSYAGLKIAPGRYSGSVYSSDLVIAGHNYAKHFSPLKWQETGTKINFIDMENRTWHYEISKIETLAPTAVKEMTTRDEDEEWDLTLFTCNTGGQTRCAIRCVSVDD